MNNNRISCYQKISPRPHWSADNNLLFPRKLWDAANSDKTLITWNEDGNGVCINESDYETRILSTHPDLVIIPTFANIRRQFREYGFNWSYLIETNEFVFSHIHFLRNRTRPVVFGLWRGASDTALLRRPPASGRRHHAKWSHRWSAWDNIPSPFLHAVPA